jgi:hypothetical protein
MELRATVRWPGGEERFADLNVLLRARAGLHRPSRAPFRVFCAGQHGASLQTCCLRLARRSRRRRAKEPLSRRTVSAPGYVARLASWGVW